LSLGLDLGVSRQELKKPNLDWFALVNQVSRVRPEDQDSDQQAKAYCGQAQE
jgi:hypothetical protein